MQIRDVFAGLALTTLGAASPVFADDDDVKLAEVPAAVRATIERETKGGLIEDLERDVRPDGTVVYEVEWERDDVEWNLHISADGKVLKRERDD